MKIFDSDGNKLKYLNELEVVKGKLWANVYLTSQIAVIDLARGELETYD